MMPAAAEQSATAAVSATKSAADCTDGPTDRSAKAAADATKSSAACATNTARAAKAAIKSAGTATDRNCARPGIYPVLRIPGRAEAI